MLDMKRQRNNVHDFVYLNEVERAVMDTPEMQRLRYIKQLGFAHLVYETAEHSRFSHSVGVCHAAKLLVDAVNRNHRIADELVVEQDAGDDRPLFRALGDRSLPASALRRPKISWHQRFCVGLAALLHDVPHPPMSHALEHECSVLVKHDDLAKNPQLFKYLFDPKSEIAAVLRRYSARFASSLFERSDQHGFDEAKAELFVTSNDLATDDLLAALVFEILGFQAPEKHPSESFLHQRDWNEPALPFHFSSFFRPFYADLLANTICADLIDYLLRDALNTGVHRGTDLKFLDRMFVKHDPDTPQRRPRIVFDLNDRRGGLRKDAVSDLLGLLETRYSLMERVYMHRTKLAASAMLGRAYLIAAAGNANGEALEPTDLYEANRYPSDDALLRFLLHNGPVGASKLAQKLLDRRIYKPLFFIDDEVCRAGAVSLEKRPLVERYRRSAGDEGWQKVIDLERRLAKALCPRDNGIVDEHPIIVFCMKEDVAYKDPRVLVEIPDRSSHNDEFSGISKVVPVPNTEGVLVLLRDFTSDHGVQSQIASMLTNYNSMWKLYVFADWQIVQKNVEHVPDVYAELVRDMTIAYPVSGLWRELRHNEVPFTRRHLLDAVKRGANIPVLGAPSDLLEFLTHASITAETESSWESQLRELGIRANRRQAAWAILNERFKSRYPEWDWVKSSVSQNDRDALKAWIIRQLTEIAAHLNEV